VHCVGVAEVDATEALAWQRWQAKLRETEGARGGRQAPQRGKVGVSYVRCRQVSKPNGAKAGLVQLSGDVGVLKVDVAAAGERLARLAEGVAELNSSTASV
jgi:hypothetical protein